MSDPIGRVATIAAQRFAQTGAAGGTQPGVLGDRGLLVPLGDDAGGPSFGETLTNAINQVSMAQERSAELTAAFLRGEPVEMHQVMAASEEAGLSLEMMVEVRNKFAEAYRTLINMQS